MALFKVGVTNAKQNIGLGPIVVEASDAEDAKKALAAREGVFPRDLEAMTLNLWTVEELPSE